MAGRFLIMIKILLKQRGIRLLLAGLPAQCLPFVLPHDNASRMELSFQVARSGMSARFGSEA
jgi:hypothetical protein